MKQNKSKVNEYKKFFNNFDWKKNGILVALGLIVFALLSKIFLIIGIFILLYYGYQYYQKRKDGE